MTDGNPPGQRDKRVGEQSEAKEVYRRWRVARRGPLPRMKLDVLHKNHTPFDRNKYIKLDACVLSSGIPKPCLFRIFCSV